MITTYSHTEGVSISIEGMNAPSEMRKELSTDEVELRELTDSTLKKLSAMSNENYAKIELIMRIFS